MARKRPDLITWQEMHSLENLRGVPLHLNPELHLSRIRKDMTEFYRAHPNPTRDDLLRQATTIDNIDRYSQDLSCRVFAGCRCGDVPEQMTLA